MKVIYWTFLILSIQASSCLGASNQDFLLTRPPHLINAADGLKYPESIYLNRHLSEFGIVSWNFQPSKTPFKFEEAIEPLSETDIAHLQESYTDGFIVVKDGEIIHEYYDKEMYKTSRHTAYSVSKSWFSAIWSDILLPVMGVKVERILPELRNTVYEGYTIRQIADMRVPIDWNLDYENKKSSLYQSYKSTGLDFESIQDDHLNLIKSLKSADSFIGGGWYYASPNTLVLERVAVKLSHLHPYVKMSDFYQKLGLEYMSGITANFKGEASSQGGGSYSLRDFVKLPYLMANNGSIKGNRIISENYIEDLFSSYEDKMIMIYSEILSLFTGNTVSYSNQWFIINPHIAVGIGSFGQYVLFDRKNNIAIAKFSTYPKNDPWTIAKELYWLVRKSQRI